MSDPFLVKVTAAAAADELEAEGELAFGPGTSLRAVAVLVVVDHGEATSTHYRFKNAVGDDLDTPAGVEMLRRVLEAVEPPST